MKRLVNTSGGFIPPIRSGAWSTPPALIRSPLPYKTSLRFIRGVWVKHPPLATPPSLKASIVGQLWAIYGPFMANLSIYPLTATHISLLTHNMPLVTQIFQRVFYNWPLIPSFIAKVFACLVHFISSVCAQDFVCLSIASMHDKRI